jgi:spore coat protein U-like protein
MGRVSRIALTGALGLAWTPVLGATATHSLQVSVMVSEPCVILPNNLSFGTYSGTELDTTTTISITCANTTGYNVGLGAGDTNGATVTTRQMTNGLQTISYALTTDPGHSLNWGNTVGTDTVTGTGNGSAQSLTVYGKIPASQFVASGAYTDTITATITY